MLVLTALPLAFSATVGVAGPASASSATVQLHGNAWFGGNGAPVCSGSGSTCDGQAPVGSPWQCVELAQRFYKQRGWYSGIFGGVSVARQIYDVALGMGMTRQPQGSITSVVPGDMLVMGGGHTIVNGVPAGHVAIVDYITTNSDGSRTVHFVNQNAVSALSQSRWHGGTIDSFWTDGHYVIGIVHSPKNRGTATGSGGSSTYEDVINGGGTQMTVFNGVTGYTDSTSTGQIYAWKGGYWGGQPAGNTGITDLAVAPGDRGYWMTDSVGHVYAYPTGAGGNSYFGGSPSGFTGRIVGIAARPNGSGYWLMSAAGQIYSYGASQYFGGSPSGYSGKFVAIVATATGNGYWLFTSAGQTYAYGDASSYGNATGFQKAIVSASATPSGHGYVMVSKTGQVYAFGDAQHFGNVSGPVAEMADISYSPSGNGYVVLDKSGHHYAFGNAPFIGNASGFAGTF